MVDVAKALAAARGADAAAIPTTLSAAEMTRGHRHARGVDPATPRVRPRIVLNDPALSASQPAAELAASAANALGHAIEGPLTPRASPVPVLAAREAVRLLAHEDDRDALALGALLAGYVIDSAGYGLHHVLAQALARFAGVWHGHANAAMLPHTTVALRRRAPEALAALDAAAGVEMEALARRLANHAGAQQLRDLGVTEEALEACVDAVMKRGKDLEGTPPAAERARGQSSLRGGLLMLELLTDLMNDAVGRCAYAEARHVDARSEAIAVLNGRVDAIDSSGSEGIGVRVQVGGGWGFAATREVTRAGAQAALAHALALAEAQPATADRALAPVAPALGHWASPYEVDPFAITLEDKLELLFAVEAALRTGDERLVRTAATCRAWRERKAFASTAGAACTQETVACGAGIVAYATDGSDLQVRSYPTAHGGGLSAAAGWEHVLALDLAGHAPRVAEEAIALLSAPQCPAGTSTIVLHGEQVALQVHESIGHALELDRILLGEASYAGTSWVGPDDLGSLRYGSDLLARHGRRHPAPRPGLLRLGRRGRGRRPRGPRRGRRAARRAVQPRERRGRGPERLGRLRPGRRLRAPADRAHDQRLARAGSRAHARRPRRRHRRGPLPGDQPLVVDRRPPPAVPVRHRAVPRDPRRRARAACTATAPTPGSRRASGAASTPICGPDEWRLWGLTNCGKGEPGQVMVVSHGAAPARFRDVQVGVA